MALGNTLVGYGEAQTRIIGNCAVGEIVKLNVDGTATEFIVVHQGNPDTTMYDSSCDGTWLLMKDLPTTGNFGVEFNIYDYSETYIDTYMTGTFLGLLDSTVQSAIKTVKIPYVSGAGSGGTVQTGANGLERKVFALSSYEVGFTTVNNTKHPVIGSKLDYFESGTTDAAKALRIATYDGTNTAWWTRSPSTANNISVWAVAAAGGQVQTYAYSGNYGYRPAFILPSDFTDFTSDSAPKVVYEITEGKALVGAQASNTLLLLHGTEIADASGYARTITNSGVTLSSEQSKFGGTSLYFNGSAKLQTDALDFGTGDFTVDLWVRPTAIQEAYFINGTNSGDFGFGLRNATTVGLLRRAVAWDSQFTVGFEANVWTHLAIVRHNGTVYYFENGVLMGTSENTQDYSTTATLIGVESGGYFTGWIDELRISNVARWTSDFTPPTARYSGTETSGAAVAYKVTGGMTLIDGVAYEIAGAPSEYTVTITGELDALYGCVIYPGDAGTKYSSATTIVAQPGEVFKIYVGSAYPSGGLSCYVSLNGVNQAITMDTNATGYTYCYYYTPTNNATITINGDYNTGYYWYRYATIIED